jgi:hypothetical protein
MEFQELFRIIFNLGDIIVHDSLVHYRANTWIDVQFLVIKKNCKNFYLGYIKTLHNFSHWIWSYTLRECL